MNDQPDDNNYLASWSTWRSDTKMMKTIWPDLSRCTTWSNGSDKSSNHVSDTHNLKMGERQSCEQPIDVDEPHAE
jgi:hypothetical protein